MFYIAKVCQIVEHIDTEKTYFTDNQLFKKLKFNDFNVLIFKI